MVKEILRTEKLTKKFPGILALNNIDFALEAGEIHGLLGENGAGKSTFIKVLTGIYKPSSGNVYFEGNKVRIQSPAHAHKLGIAAVYQELNLISFLSGADNIFLGSEPINFPGFINRKEILERSQRILSELGAKVDLSLPTGSLTASMRQVIAICKLLLMKCKILILDEPTSYLSPEEVAHFFTMIRKLQGKGVGIIYISHRLKEITQLCDRVTVFRDGQNIGTVTKASVNEENLINMMVGEEISDLYPKSKFPLGDVVFSCHGLSHGTQLHNLSFELRAGEILGITGLVGSGIQTIPLALLGIGKNRKGSFSLDGKTLRINNPSDAMKLGIAVIPADRRREGLFFGSNISTNYTLARLGYFIRFGLIQVKKEFKATQDMIKKLSVAASGPRQLASTLSGGNQQKIMVGRYIFSNARVYVFNEPTAGVDVGAKTEIYGIIESLAKEGAGILFISSDFEELLGICDRILVLYDGNVCLETVPDHIDQAGLLSYCSGRFSE